MYDQFLVEMMSDNMREMPISIIIFEKCGKLEHFYFLQIWPGATRWPFWPPGREIGLFPLTDPVTRWPGVYIELGSPRPGDPVLVDQKLLVNKT